ncbi:MAG: hypothetical protein ACJAS9_001378 [Polaribacter sp.]|jgi:hypothetical protein
MNIGEIKKPTVDGQLVKPKHQEGNTAPVTLAKPIGDQIDISIKAKERFIEYSNKRNKKKKKESKQINSSKTEQDLIQTHIDIIA